MIFFPVLWKRNSMSVPEQILSKQAEANSETTGFNPTDLIKAWPSQYIPVVPTPLQLGFCCLPVREMLFGGACGGGKSEALLMAALQYVDVPGYSAIIFRKTFADLARNEGLLDRATKWLAPHLGKTIKYQPVTRSFHFSSGAVLAFGYMGSKGAQETIQGAEYQFCLEKSEKIKMGDGSLKTLSDICVGDLVLTLEGPKPVTQVFPARETQCVKAETIQGSQIQSVDHRLLTSSGWMSFLEISNQCCSTHNNDELSQYTSQVSLQQHELRQSYPLPTYEQLELSACQSFFQDSYASLGDGQTYSEGYCDSPLEIRQLQELFYLSAPVSLVSLSEESYLNNQDHLYEICDVQPWLLVPDSQDDCHSYSCFCDGPFHWDVSNDRSCLPLLNDVALPFRLSSLHKDAMGNVPLHSHSGLSYSHPYTTENRTCFYDVFDEPCNFSPVGKREVIDIRVADANHYISSTNFINQNCGIDEVTQHLESDALWTISRLRKKEGVNVPLRVRWTGNPGGTGHQWVKNYYQIKRNPEYDPEVGTTIGEHIFSEQPMFIGNHPSRMFIPARLVDNPYIDQEAYIPSLKSLDPLTRSQLLDGDWDASPSSRFRKEWFLRYTRRGDYITVGSKTFNIRNGIRFATVDVAASVREGVAGEQFYTRGGSMQQAEPCWTVISTWMVIDKFMFLLDVNRMQVEAPDIFAQMKRVMNEWEVRDFIVEGNGVGRPVAQVAQRQGLPVREIWTTHDKIQNSYTAANMAKAGQIVLPDERLELHWLGDFEGELFTWMGHPEETCDQVDTVSTAAKEAQTIVIPTDNITNSAELLPLPMGGMRSARESSSMLPHSF